MLLAIDTSAGSSAAIVDLDGRVRAEASEPDTRRHAEAIGILIARVLDAAGVASSGVTAVVTGMGPGPFTGLRVGIAAGRAFAAGIGVPVLPVGSHEAIAHERMGSAPALVVTDARRREVAWSVFDGRDPEGLPDRRLGPALAPPDELDAVVPAIGGLERIDAAEVSAGALGTLALRLRELGRIPSLPEPLYLRSPDVTPSPGKRVTP